MKISILLTTHNREQDAKTCLTKLLVQKQDDIEIILLDDCHLKNESLKSFCDVNNINYVHTGAQKNGEYKWRMPGYALNIGVKLAKADYIIIGNCEILQLDDECVSKMYAEKDKVSSPKVYDQLHESNWKQFRILESRQPWFWGMPKQIYLDIGGFDEDFIGTAFDDLDFADRVFSSLSFVEVSSQVIHLWNPHVGGGDRWMYNKNLYESRKGIVKRNVGKDWGIL